MKKLTLTYETRLADLYSVTQWMNDLTGLPAKEKMRTYTSLDAYNYVLNKI